MIFVERGNVVLRIEDDDVQRYLDKGYNVTDGRGHVLQRSIPQDIGELRHLVVKYEQEIKDLKAEIEELKSATISVEDSIDEPVKEDKPKRGRPKKSE